MIAVMHQLDDALRFTDRALLLQAGRQVGLGPTAEVIDAANVERVYGVSSCRAARSASGSGARP